jgi:hypothetical protein
MKQLFKLLFIVAFIIPPIWVSGKNIIDQFTVVDSLYNCAKYFYE